MKAYCLATAPARRNSADLLWLLSFLFNGVCTLARVTQKRQIVDSIRAREQQNLDASFRKLAMLWAIALALNS